MGAAAIFPAGALVVTSWPLPRLIETCPAELILYYTSVARGAAVYGCRDWDFAKRSFQLSMAR